MIANLDDANNRIVTEVTFYDEDDTIRCWELENRHIEKMLYHTPIGDGDKHFVDVYFNNGECYRIFEPIKIKFNVCNKVCLDTISEYERMNNEK